MQAASKLEYAMEKQKELKDEKRELEETLNDKTNELNTSSAVVRALLARSTDLKRLLSGNNNTHKRTREDIADLEVIEHKKRNKSTPTSCGLS